MRKRIPLSKQLLLLVLKIAKEYKSVYVIALFGTFVQAAYAAFWSFAAVAIYQRFTPGAAGSGSSSSNGAVIGCMVFAVFHYYWMTRE